MAGNGSGSQVYAYGAIDSEPGFGATYASTKAWADAFDSATVSFYVDYGSADGCPERIYSNGPCNHGWTQAEEEYVSWHGAAFPMPEVYTTAVWHPLNHPTWVTDAMALQWEMIALYGKTINDSMAFLGPITEHASDSSTNTPTQGYNDLWYALNDDSRVAQSPLYETDIQHGY